MGRKIYEIVHSHTRTYTHARTHTLTRTLIRSHIRNALINIVPLGGTGGVGGSAASDHLLGGISPVLIGHNLVRTLVRISGGLAANLADDVGQRFDVVLSQGQGLDLTEASAQPDVRNYFSKLLESVVQ